MNKILLLPLALICCGTASAKVTLPNYITDNMVVQHDATLTVKGHATPGAKVRALPTWMKKGVEAKAGADGTFEMKIETPAAGGPYSIVFDDGEQTILHNILSGEVWLCSGQSNMEMPVQGWTTVMDYDNVIATAHRPDIRLLQVRKTTALTPQEDVQVNMGGWQECNSATMPDFSAIAYFFASRLADELHTPIGVIDTTWGGTPAEAWTSLGGVEKIAGFEGEVNAIRTCAGDRNAMDADFSRRTDDWNKLIQNADIDFDRARLQTSWPLMPAGRYFDQSVLTGLDGVVWAQYGFELPAECDGKPLTLHLGAIDDDEITYLNGKEIGRTSGCSVPRHYSVPAGIARKGENVISMKITDFGGEGGFGSPADAMYAECGDVRIPLGGDWRYAVAADFSTLPPRPVSPYGSSFPTSLYNAMLQPLSAMPIEGVLWYQGCANVGRAGQYEPLFQTLITDWRKLWGDNLPFYFVQLAGYLQPRTLQPDSEWAALREAQARALHLPNTAMAVAIDLGNPADIHPKNKQQVAERLARIALARNYGRDIAYAAPRCTSAKPGKGKITLTFDGKVSPTSSAVTGFIVGDGKGNFAPATGHVTDATTIELETPLIANPTVARYNWADYPGGNLYGEGGLPVAPFATDDPLNDAKK